MSLPSMLTQGKCMGPNRLCAFSLCPLYGQRVYTLTMCKYPEKVWSRKKIYRNSSHSYWRRRNNKARLYRQVAEGCCPFHMVWQYFASNKDLCHNFISNSCTLKWLNAARFWTALYNTTFFCVTVSAGTHFALWAYNDALHLWSEICTLQNT